MHCTSFRRKTILLLLAAMLSAPWASAAPSRSESPRPADAVEPAPLKLLSRAWMLLRSVWAKEGCGIDPFGRCISTKEGCRIDPFGRCLSGSAPELEADEGCNIDPFGRCQS